MYSHRALSSAHCTLNIGNGHVRCVVQYVGARVAEPVAEEEQRVYARCLPSVRAADCDYRSVPNEALAGDYQSVPHEALAHVDVARSVSAANFENCWRA